MLDLFRRSEDPDNYFGGYVVSSAVLLARLGGAAYAGSGQLDDVAGSVGIVAAVCCISASESRVGDPTTPP